MSSVLQVRNIEVMSQISQEHSLVTNNLHLHLLLSLFQYFLETEVNLIVIQIIFLFAMQ